MCIVHYTFVIVPTVMPKNRQGCLWTTVTLHVQTETAVCFIWAMENRKGPLGELGQNLINCIFVVIEHVRCYCNALCIGTSMFH